MLSGRSASWCSGPPYHSYHNILGRSNLYHTNSHLNLLLSPPFRNFWSRMATTQALQKTSMASVLNLLWQIFFPNSSPWRVILRKFSKLYVFVRDARLCTLRSRNAPLPMPCLIFDNPGHCLNVLDLPGQVQIDLDKNCTGFVEGELVDILGHVIHRSTVLDEHTIVLPGTRVAR